MDTTSAIVSVVVALLAGIWIGRKLGVREGMAAMFLAMNQLEGEEETPEWVRTQREQAPNQ